MQTTTAAPPNKPNQQPPERPRDEKHTDLLHQVELILCLSYFLEVGEKNPEAYKLITLAQMQDQQTDEYIVDIHNKIFNRA